MQRITPMLWFDGKAEEAAKFYTSIFKKSKITRIMRQSEATARSSGGRKGSVLTVEFELAGQEFVAMNGGPGFPFTEAVSFMVNCKSQAEVDRYWKKLLAGGGKEVQCGWLKDKFGVSWQVTPAILMDLMTSKDKPKANRVAEAMMKMVKIDIKAIKQAAKKPKKAAKKAVKK